MPAHLVAPYDATNSTVRVRGLRWIERAVERGLISLDEVAVHAPGFDRSPVRPRQPVLLLRNARKLTRGRLESRLLRAASPGVYDLDDGLPWDDGNLPGLGHWTKRPFPRSLVARRAARAADRVLVGNEVLADWATSHNRDVRVVPTCVEPAEYDVRTGWDVGPTPRLGWIGSPATEGYLTEIAPALAEVHRRTGARLTLVSGPGPVPSALAGFTDKLTWTPDSDRLIATWDIGLMPLRDGVYERAKCGYKLLQYGASGVPAVGSPVGVNRQLLADMDGMAPTTRSEWVDALLELLAEPTSRRESRARSGLATVSRFSYSAWERTFYDSVGWTTCA